MDKLEFTKEQINLKEMVLAEYTRGNIVVSRFDGLGVGNLEAIMQQPIEGILYDCNRDEGTILTFLNDPKWVNDYALMKICKHLYKENQELKEQLSKLTDSNLR